MTTNIASLANFASMSQAAYLDLQGLQVGDPLLVQQLQRIGYAQDKVFAEGQANNFTAPSTGNSFVSQSPGLNGNDDFGFSATVFKSNADNAYTIAVRGTEPGAQGLVDLWRADGLGVVLAGKAIEQLISAYRYYKELVSSTTLTAAGIYSEAEIAMLCQLYARTLPAILSGPAIEVKMALFVDSLRHDLGLGLIPEGAPINFTGHSLGGHVATLLATMVATNDTTHAVGQVCTYNAPGQDAIPNEIFNWLGIPTGSNGGVLQDKIINVIGEGGLNVTAGLGSLPGPKQTIFIESEGWSTGNPILINNHSVVKQSDSLAVYALFGTLDPTLNINGLDTINSLLKDSANLPANSLEGALAALGKLFGKTYSAIESTRDSFYANLYDLQASAEYKALAGSAHLRVLANTDRDTLASNARTDFGAFLAVHFLLPLSLDGAWGVLGTIHTDLYAKYQLDNTLSATERDAGQANFSDQYLADRETMLAWLLQGNQQDALSNSTTMFVKTTQPGVSEIWQFTDVGSGRNVQVSPTLAQGRHEVYFGNEEDNSFTGRMREDYLYGGGGNDILEAGTGRVCKPPVLRTQPSDKDRRRVSACENCICAPYALGIFSGKGLSANHEICQRAAQWVS